MRDHGGNIDEARARFGGTGWIDLSTGINRVPYPLPEFPSHVWTDLPTRRTQSALMVAARTAFATQAPGLALAGAQAAIQMLPRIAVPGQARVLAPTYNEHAACLRAAGWQVEEVRSLDALAGAELAVVVNPNNPDGRRTPRTNLRAIAGQVGRLIVDESFAEATPDLSLAADADEHLVVLRSFGKFWGLAGLRLGFVFGGADVIAQLAEMAGPWPVSGAALEVGRIALGDHPWRASTIARLAGEAQKLDQYAALAGWDLVGGTHLFRTYHAPDAKRAQDFLGHARIWSRIFPYSRHWVRLGLPGNGDEWARVAVTLGNARG